MRCVLPLVMGLAAPLAGADDPQGILDDLVARLRKGPSALDGVLDQYCRIEGQKHVDVFGRQRIHEGLLKELRGMADPALLARARDLLASRSKADFPAQVLVLKAAIGGRFPAAREERLKLLLQALRSKDEALAVWGARLLGDSRWPESADALIAALAEAEATTEPDSFPINLISMELHRVLGSKAAQGGSGRIRAAWEAMGKKLPASPSYDPVESDAVTSAFFGDRVSPRSVLCIDTSSSMLQRTSLRSAGSQGRTVVKGERDRERSKATERKIDIVKRELERTVLALRPSCKFNVLSYNAAVLPWRGKGELKLHPANEGSLKDAAEFARRLATATGTNIHDALAEALEVPGVETVYLLSDGVPSVGGTKEEIERRVAALNYLRGVRIITYGFAAEESGAYDEDFMRRLAQRNWGWYRRLN